MRDYVMHQAENLESTHAFAKIRRVLTNWYRRRMLNELRDLDDYILADIGITRDELGAVMRLPLYVDPVRELERKSKARMHDRRYP